MSIACNPTYRTLLIPRDFVELYLNTDVDQDKAQFTDAEWSDINSAKASVKKLITEGNGNLITHSNLQFYEFRSGNYEVMLIRYVTKLLNERVGY
jgi:hypothetical protein